MIPVTPCLDSESVRISQSKSLFVPEKKETLAVRELLDGLNSGDLAICVSFLQQSIGDTSSLACSMSGTLDGLEKRVSLPVEAKKRFMQILSRLVKGQEGLSRLEIAFIRHIWHEVRGDWERTVGSPIDRGFS